MNQSESRSSKDSFSANSSETDFEAEDNLISLDPSKFDVDGLTLSELEERYEDLLDKKYEMNTDIRSLLVVSFMHRKALVRFRKVLMVHPMVLTVLCYVMQIYGTFALHRHVVENMAYGMSVGIELGIWQLSNAGKVLYTGHLEDICGKYEHYELQQPLGGASVVFPDGCGTTSETSFSAKSPFWLWDTFYAGPNRGILDNARYVIDEEFGEIWHGYRLLSIGVIFLWIAVTVIALRDVTRFFMMLVSVPRNPDAMDLLKLEVEYVKEDEGSWFINYMNLQTKCLGFLVFFIQLGIIIYVGVVGAMFLALTTAKVDLLLNSLAMTFILEMDQILVAALMTNSQQSFVSRLDPVVYKSMLPKWYRARHNVIFPLLAIVTCCLLCEYTRHRQVEFFSHVFNSATALCLLGGKSEVADDYVPINGFCESALSFTCSGPGCTTLSEGCERCVITDFDVGWAKDIKTASNETIWATDLFQPHAVSASIWDYLWNDDPRIQQKYFREHGRLARSTEVVIRACYSMYRPRASVGQRLLKGAKGKAKPKRKQSGSGGQSGPSSVVSSGLFGCNKFTSNLLNENLRSLGYSQASFWEVWHVPFEFDLLGKNAALGENLGLCN